MLLILSYTSPYPMHALDAQAWLATIAAENPQHAAHTCMSYMRMHLREVERCDARSLAEREVCGDTGTGAAARAPSFCAPRTREMLRSI